MESSSNQPPDSPQIIYYPVVRYGYDTKDGGKRQALKFRSIHDPIPETAKYVSPVYFLTESDHRRYEQFSDKPYANAGDGNIVKELQDDCEEAGRVLSPLHVETDKLDPAENDSVSVELAVEWLTEFIENDLNVAIDICTFYHSGSRSIHVHVPQVMTEEQRIQVGNFVQEFNTDRIERIDKSNYSTKSQFRLPGVEHHKTGGRKIKLEPPYTPKNVAQTVAGNVTTDVETYADVIQDVFNCDISALLNSDLISRNHVIRRMKPRNSILPWKSISSTSLSTVVV